MGLRDLVIKHQLLPHLADGLADDGQVGTPAYPGRPDDRAEQPIPQNVLQDEGLAPPRSQRLNQPGHLGGNLKGTLTNNINNGRL